MSELTYEDFKQRINIQEVLQDAGYNLNRKDGIRYPSYVRLDSNGRRIRGDKFIVTRNGMCCFQPPEQRNYNIISFIKEHPHFFAEYTPGMSKDRLVNLVCNRLLNQPITERNTRVLDPEKNTKPFNKDDYEWQPFNKRDWDNQKKFYPYFKSRGIELFTQRAFADCIFLTTKRRNDGKRFTNLSFPLTIPGQPNQPVGLEERGRPNQEGKMMYKGMAAGSNATQGLWIANPEHQALSKIKNVYWFESALDAMAFWQLNGCRIDMRKSVFVSTAGSPSQQQFKGMIAETPNAHHHLCFDRDRAGQVFAINFALTREGKNFSSYLSKAGKLIVQDCSGEYKRHEITLEPFHFEEIAETLGIRGAEPPYPKDMNEYVSSLMQWDKVTSGDTELLPSRFYDLCGKYESLVEEYESSRCSGLVCKEDLDDLGAELDKAYETYKKTLQTELAELPPQPTGYLLYEPAAEGYKDWNDQLLDKRMEPEREAEENAVEQRSGFRR